MRDMNQRRTFPGWVKGVTTCTSLDKLALKQCEHVEAAACKVSKKKKCTEVDTYSKNIAVFYTCFVAAL